METFNEKSSAKDLTDAWEMVDDYSSQAMRPVQNKFSKKFCMIARRVNTPQGLPALYGFYKKKKDSFRLSALLIEGTEGTSIVTLSSSTKGGLGLFMIRSHAVNRYMQRHGFDGTFNQCQEYIFCNMWVSSQNIDPITQDIVLYFDGGVFLGKKQNGISYINTYVLNPHLYPHQRLMSKRLQEKIEQVFEEARNSKH